MICLIDEITWNHHFFWCFSFLRGWMPPALQQKPAGRMGYQLVHIYTVLENAGWYLSIVANQKFMIHEFMKINEKIWITDNGFGYVTSQCVVVNQKFLILDSESDLKISNKFELRIKYSDLLLALDRTRACPESKISDSWIHYLNDLNLNSNRLWFPNHLWFANHPWFTNIFIDSQIFLRIIRDFFP